MTGNTSGGKADTALDALLASLAKAPPDGANIGLRCQRHADPA